MTETRKLRVFLCHSSQDRLIASKLSQLLNKESWIDSWLSENVIDPLKYDEMLKTERMGMYEREIKKHIQNTDVVIVCLSKISVSKRGYEQKIFVHPLHRAQEMPEGSIVIIPLRSDDCVPPVRFQLWRWVDYFNSNGYNKLIQGLYSCFSKLGNLLPESNNLEQPTLYSSSKVNDDKKVIVLIRVLDFETKHCFWISQHPVTCVQYERFLSSEDYSEEEYWTEFPIYDESGKYFGVWKGEYLGGWRDEGFSWLKKQREIFTSYPIKMSRVQPHNWKDNGLTLVEPNAPVKGISWYEANAYCKWLTKHWRDNPELVIYSEMDASLPLVFRLPTEQEWIAGVKLGGTKSPNSSPDGATPENVMCVPRNLNEWLANYSDESHENHAMFDGELFLDEELRDMSRLPYKWSRYLEWEEDNYGFRVICSLG